MKVSSSVIVLAVAVITATVFPQVPWLAIAAAYYLWSQLVVAVQRTPPRPPSPAR